MNCLNLLNTSSAIVTLVYTCDSELIESAWMQHLWAAEMRWRKYENCMFLHTHATVWKHPWIHACHTNGISAQACMHVGERFLMHSTQTWTSMRASTNTRSIYIIHRGHNSDIFFLLCWSCWMKVKLFSIPHNRMLLHFKDLELITEDATLAEKAWFSHY